MHPEYPCAHCIVSGAVGAVLVAEIGSRPTPTLSTTSSTAPGVVRSWTSIDDSVVEVANSRIYDGVHYRNSAAVGTAMGKKIGALTAPNARRPPPRLSRELTRRRSSAHSNARRTSRLTRSQEGAMKLR